MSPPGKNSGRTTYESVVMANRPQGTLNKAESWRVLSIGLPNALPKTSSSNWCISRPPPPCAIRTRGYCEIGSGQAIFPSGVFTGLPYSDRAAAAVAVVRCTGAFARHHGRPQRMLRGATAAKRRAVRRFFQTLQNQAGKTLHRFLHAPIRQAEFFLRVEGGEFVAQTQPALWNFAQAAPLARNDLENSSDQGLRRSVAFAANEAAVLIFHFRGPDSS